MTGGVNDFKTSTAIVSFAVTEVNDPPKGTNDVLSAVAEDFEPRVIAFAELLSNDSKGPANEVGQSLAIIEVRGATGGTVSIVGSDVVFTPTPNFHGFAFFEYVLRDNGTSGGANEFLTSTAVVLFQVSAVNDRTDGGGRRTGGHRRGLPGADDLAGRADWPMIPRGRRTKAGNR